MRRQAPRRLATALDTLTAELAPATTIARVQGRWAEAVGDGIAAAAEPVSEREGVVTVACDAAVWAQELELLGPELVGRLNEALGHTPDGGPVRRLRVVVGRPRDL